MRSLIIIEVEHGEDTDGVQAYADYIVDPMGEWPVTVSDYTVRTDIPPFLTAVNINAVIDRGAGVTQ